MRPLRLTLEGFRSHRGRTVLDFEGRSLVGIVGPNGSGKSSLLDGVAYALYGKTPADGRGGQKLINARAEAARVELWFSAGGETYRVTRLQRRRGTTQQALEQWDGVDGTKLATVADKKAEIAEEVERLVGLDFDAFARSALLAQNRFADLLTAPPAEAAKVLTGLFGFGVIEEMRQIASTRLAEVRAELRRVEEAERALVDVRREASEAGGRAEAAEAKRADLARLVEAVAEHDDALRRIEEEAAGVAAELERLDAAVAELPSSATRDRIVGEAAAHAATLAGASARLAEAALAADEAKAAVDQALAADLPGAISGLANAIERSSEMTRRLGEAERAEAAARQDLSRGGARLEAAEAAAAAATDRLASARAGVEEADRLVARLEQGHAAHLLSEGLHPGDPCPVCDRPVEVVPERDAPDGLDEARTAADAGRREVREAEEAAAAAAGEVAGARAAVEAAGAAVERSEAARASASEASGAASDALRAAVRAVEGDEDDPLGALSAARVRWEGLQQAATRTTSAREEASAAVSALEAADAGGALADLIDAARPAAALVGVEVPRAPTPESTTECFSKLDEAVGAARDRLGSAGEAIGVRRAAAVEARAEVLSEAGLEADADPGVLLTSAGEAAAVARTEERLLGARVAELEAALADAEQTAAAAVRLARLQGDLAPGRFPQYLLDERRRGLADHGSEHLEVLSGGRYRFVLEDNQFKVRDLSAADVVRDADTLSGGELFLASLALALGLATLVGLDRGTLEAFFIDEGFGSLDDESLELAMDGLERMAADGDRLVVVVSHVPEMRERLVDLVELAKDPLTNDTVVIRD